MNQSKQYLYVSILLMHSFTSAIPNIAGLDLWYLTSILTLLAAEDLPIAKKSRSFRVATAGLYTRPLEISQQTP